MGEGPCSDDAPFDRNGDPAAGWETSAVNPDPDAGSPTTVIDRLCARVHRALREDRLVSDDVVELACALMDQGHGGQAVREAVERTPAQVSPEEPAESAARILDEAGYDPGFEPAPGQLAVLYQALRIAARDLPDAGIGGEPEFVVTAGLDHGAARIRLADGRLLAGLMELSGGVGDHLPGAVVAVADQVQSALSESSWRVWPVCPDHGLGVHSLERSGVAVWWCAADGGHAVARVGTLCQGGEAPW